MERRNAKRRSVSERRCTVLIIEHHRFKCTSNPEYAYFRPRAFPNSLSIFRSCMMKCTFRRIFAGSSSVGMLRVGAWESV